MKMISRKRAGAGRRRCGSRNGEGRRRPDAGSVYAELLLSFFVWLVIVIYVVPAFMHITVMRKELLIRNEASRLLNAQVLRANKGLPVEERIAGDSGTVFIIVIEEGPEGRRVCVKYEARKEREERICEKVRG